VRSKPVSSTGTNKDAERVSFRYHPRKARYAMTPVHVRSRTRSAVLTLLGVLLALAAATSTATASTNTASSHPAFGTQASSLGLTSTQAATLQAEVNGYISKLGGTQVAINKINLNNRGYVLLALPGKQTLVPHVCGYGYFCAYSGANFTGDSVNMYYCHRYLIPFTSSWRTGSGSWANNQYKNTPTRARITPTRARMYNRATPRRLIYTTPKPYSQDKHANWTPVAIVQPC
jgi:hypothetical protein